MNWTKSRSNPCCVACTLTTRSRGGWQHGQLMNALFWHADPRNVTRVEYRTCLQYFYTRTYMLPPFGIIGTQSSRQKHTEGFKEIHQWDPIMQRRIKLSGIIVVYTPRQISDQKNIRSNLSDKYSSDSCWINRNKIVSTVFWLIWTKQNPVWFKINKIQSEMRCKSSRLRTRK